MSINFGVNILKQMLKSGNAIGTEVKLTKVTEMIAKNPKAVAEQIGNLLGAESKKVTDLIGTAGFEEITARLDELAKRFPDAAIKLGIKQSKRGFTVVKTSVKDGEKEVLKQAASISKDGTIKSRGKVGRANVHSYSDSTKRNFTYIAEQDNLKAAIKGNKKDFTVNLKEGGEEILSARAKFNKHAAGTQVSYETVDGLSYFNFDKQGIGLSGIYDKSRLVQFIKKEISESKEQTKKFIDAVAGKKGEGKPNALLLQILRPLRERFNTAIDLYKYNGITFFEKFLSKGELKAELTKIIGEERSLSKKISEALRTTEPVSISSLELSICPKEVKEAFAYREQLRNDIEQARELITVYC